MRLSQGFKPSTYSFFFLTGLRPAVRAYVQNLSAVMSAHATTTCAHVGFVCVAQHAVARQGVSCGGTARKHLQCVKGPRALEETSSDLQ